MGMIFKRHIFCVLFDRVCFIRIKLSKVILIFFIFFFNSSLSFAQKKSFDISVGEFSEITDSKEKSALIFKDAKRVRELNINPSLQRRGYVASDDTLVLDLFDDKNYRALVKEVNVDINSVLTINAKIENSEFGTCLLSTYDGKSFMVIEIPEKHEFFIMNFDHQQGKYFLKQLDGLKMDKLEGAPSLIPPVEGKSSSSNQGKEDGEMKSVTSNEGSVALESESTQDTITVLIVYTPSAASWSTSNETNINNTISALMTKAQLALSNSNTLLTIQLAHSEQVSYTELNNGTDLNNLTYTSDGYMDNVHALRDAYCADVVVLLENIGFTGGLGWILSYSGGMPAYAFSLTRVQQASWTYTTIHEIGHNMGCHHHKEQTTQPGPGLYSYSAGWRWTGTDAGQYCSVMTYENGSYFSDGITHTQVPYFSNPSIQFKGVATGNATDGDNARTLRQTKAVVAAYRSGCVVVDPVPQNLVLADTTINSGFVHCFNAYDTITAAGETSVVFLDGASVDLIAGKSVILKPGFYAFSGSSVHARITQDSSFCYPSSSTSIVEQPVLAPSEDDSSLPVEIINDERTIKVFPNPNSGIFNIELRNINESSEVVVYNIVGSEVLRLRTSGSERYLIDLSKQEKGIYFVKVINVGQQFVCKVIVK